jgi:hypothetical protein
VTVVSALSSSTSTHSTSQSTHPASSIFATDSLIFHLNLHKYPTRIPPAPHPFSYPPRPLSILFLLPIHALQSPSHMPFSPIHQEYFLKKNSGCVLHMTRIPSPMNHIKSNMRKTKPIRRSFCEIDHVFLSRSR